MNAKRYFAALVASHALTLYGCSTIENAADLAESGFQLRESGRFTDSAARFIEATRAEPDFCTAYINAAESFRRGQRLNEAIATLEHAGPCRENPEVLLVSAVFRQEAGDYDGATRALAMLVRIEPDVPSHYVRLGDISKAAGDLKTARRYYEMARARSADDPKVTLAFARLVAVEENRSAAVNAVELAVQEGFRADMIGMYPELSGIRNEPRIIALVDRETARPAPADSRSSQRDTIDRLSTQLAQLSSEHSALQRHASTVEGELRTTKTVLVQEKQAGEDALHEAASLRSRLSLMDSRITNLAVDLAKLRSESLQVVQGPPGPAGPAGVAGQAGATGRGSELSDSTLLNVILVSLLAGVNGGVLAHLILARVRSMWSKDSESSDRLKSL